jgi:acrylyl-CoA reductase (NADPH)/3-hydroxypropionyl-CoA dehydratase/3-hydroxypropionyl-CoA synthetase
LTIQTTAIRNSIRTRADWERMRAACEASPGKFHGDRAKRMVHWLVADGAGGQAWVQFDDASRLWRGWDAKSGAIVDLELPETFEPWTRAFNTDDPPHWRWFEGGLTNAAFNEVDRHVLAGRGAETALIFEGDRWDLAADAGRGGPVDAYPISRKLLLLESAKCALALRALGLSPGDRIALNMPNIPEQIFWTEGAKRFGIVYTPVFGGFSDKTLSDRIHDAGARIVVTSDGSYRNAQVAPFKTAFTDPALDNYIAASVAHATAVAELEKPALGLAADQVAVIGDALAAALSGEMTVERSDVMRELGRALDTLSGAIDPATVARTRIAVAEALVATPPRVEAVVVVRHVALPDLTWRADRDRWSHELTDAAAGALIAAARAAGFDVASEADLLALPDEDFVRAVWASAPPLAVDAEFPLFFIYTSGSTGKPKGVVHVHGGYVAGVADTMATAFDARPGDVLYVVADPGWITGQSYMICAALAAGVTSVVTEGAPVFPHSGRFASIIERYKVTIFKAGVTFLKTIMQDPQNLRDVKTYDLSSLRVATFCAEPASPSVQAFGMAEITPNYINSYWATEHGGIVWTHFYGNSDFPLRADAHTWPLPWIGGDVWVEDPDAPPAPPPANPIYARDGEDGAAWRRAEDGERGEIVIATPYPYLARTVWGDSAGFKVVGNRADGAWKGDAERWANGYWRRWRGRWAYTQGDFAVRHGDGSFSLHGRSDDVINVSGHRMGTEEIEGAILRDKALNPGSPVGNVLVVGAPHRDKGLTPLAFITPVPGRRLGQDDRKRLLELVRQEKGAVAVPSDFLEVPQFPETRSGKYMRRMIRALVEGRDLGDTSTLRNPESLGALRDAVDAWRRRQQLSDDQQLFERYRYFIIQYNDVAPGKRVATVTVNNPPVNALNERSIDELVIVADHLAHRDDVVAVVFTGAGTASFVAGADIRQFLEEIHSLEDAKVLPNNAQLAFRKIETMGKPCIAAIQGVALGGGMEFALACHYRIAEDFSRFGQPEIRLRLLPGYGGTQRLPRLLAARRGQTGLRDSLDLILGGRSIDGPAAHEIGLIDTLAGDGQDVLSLAHAAVRAFVRDGENSALGRAYAERRALTSAWESPGEEDLEAALGDEFVQAIRRQLDWAGRGPAGALAIEAIRTGWSEGLTAGLAKEAELFAHAVIDPEGGKTGIRQFLDKTSPPLPIRRESAAVVGAPADRAAALETAGELLPVGAPFYPGVTAIPSWQYAFGVARDPRTGAPGFGPPATHERELIVPVGEPGPNDALLYMLTSEVNFNDIWALTGIPVSPFDGHEEDVQTTGSGGVALIAALGAEVKREGRLKVGDLVCVYSGTSDLLSPKAGDDPMFADFAIQGYETATGSHAQFLIAQAPQLHSVPGDLTLEQAGSYVLNLGTVTRALFTTLKIAPGKTLFVEGAATGTGLDALKSARSAGLSVTGLVSSPTRADFIRGMGAVGAIDRTSGDLAALFTAVPEDPEAAIAWEESGAPLLKAYEDLNGGKLADYVVSHAGETAFPRSFQLLAENGSLAFYGASSGYHFSFMGKKGAASPEAMLRRAMLRGGEAVLVYYGAGSPSLLDEVGLEMIECLREFGARVVVATDTDGQREFLQSLGFNDAVAGMVSLEDLARREGRNFHWPRTMPRLPMARDDIEAFKAGVRDYQDRTLKPFGTAIGRLLRSEDNPRGNPDLILERAAQDSLGVSTSLVKPFTGRVVYAEEMAGRRYTFYAPQVWTRQRRILMPTASILGTHLCNAFEVSRMNDMIAAGMLSITEPVMVDWRGLPEAHQSMWENRHSGATYVVNHALPAPGLRGRDALLENWASQDLALNDTSRRPGE